MKKNARKVFLFALALLTVISMGSVSGTYAKYVSQVDLTDEARVAKWQLNVKDINGNVLNDTKKINLFAESYSFNGKEYVKSLGVDGGPNHVAKVVAPGTKGEYQVNLSGAMETRYNIEIKFDELNNNEPVVKYDVDENGVVTINPENGAYEYRPMKYSVSFWNGFDSKTYFNVTGSLADIKTELAKEENKIEFAPHRMQESITIGWSWDKQNTVVAGAKTLAPAEVDKLDTYIGEHWVDKGVSTTDPNYQWSFGSAASAKYQLSIIATQVAENHSTDTTK